MPRLLSVFMLCRPFFAGFLPQVACSRQYRWYLLIPPGTGARASPVCFCASRASPAKKSKQDQPAKKSQKAEPEQKQTKKASKKDTDSLQGSEAKGKKTERTVASSAKPHSEEPRTKTASDSPKASLKYICAEPGALLCSSLLVDVLTAASQRSVEMSA